MSKNRSELSKRLSKWLEREGYPLEMMVAQTFRRAGFVTIQSEFYDDPETGKSREIDVSAWMQRELHDILVRVQFCIECKLSKDKPWVMFTSSDIRLADPARISQRAASILGLALLVSISQREDICNLPVFQIPERPGYALTQAFSTGHDVPYTAVISAAKASLAEAKDANRWSRTVGPACEIVFPVVVIDGLLFECYLKEAGEVVVEEIEAGTLVWRSPVVGMPHTIVQVVTLPAIGNFVREAFETSYALLEKCENEILELSKKIPADAPRYESSRMNKPNQAIEHMLKQLGAKFESSKDDE